MIESPSLIVSDHWLTLLSSACTSFMLNQVYSLARVYHRPISWRFHKRLPFALVELVYHRFRASIQHGVDPLWAMLSWSHLCLHVSVLFGDQRECIFVCAEDRFSLEVLTPMGDVIPDVEIWESSFPFWVSARVVGPRGLSNGAWYKQSHEAQSNSTRWYVIHTWKKKLHGRLKSFLPSRSSAIIFFFFSFHDRCIHHHVWCPLIS
jgi:hypothetical protein